MQKTLPIFILLIVLLGACQSRQQTDSTSADSLTATVDTSAAVDAVSISPVLLTDRLRRLGLTANSHWRGINLGDTFTRVGQTEKGKPFEQKAGQVGYTVEFPNLESMDVQYYEQNQHVAGIDVDLYLTSQQAVAEHRRDLETYFQARFGTPKTEQGATVWTAQSGETVSLRDVSKGKDFGLKIRISSADRADTTPVQ